MVVPLMFRRTGCFFHGLFVEPVVVSWICRGSGGFFVDFRRSGGFFVDCSWIWWFFHGFFVEMVVFSWILR